jgi:type I restriction enzyme, S subunit
MLQPESSSPRDKVTPYLRAGSLSQLQSEDDLPAMWCSETDLERYSVRPGDLLVAEGGDVGRTEWVPDLVQTTIIQNSLHRLRTSKDDIRYLRYCLQALHGCGWIDVVCNRSTFGHLTVEKLSSLQVPHPHVATQASIADDLDGETQRIDELVAQRRRMIDLLDEWLSARCTDLLSGQPGWPLKRLLSGPMAYGVLVPRFVPSGTGTPMLRINNLGPDGEIRLDEVASIETGLSDEYQRTILSTGDLVLSVVGSMGRSAIVPPEASGWNLNRPLARLRVESPIATRLLWHWTRTVWFMNQALVAVSSGAAQPTLNLGDLANFRVGLPLDVDTWPDLLCELDAHFKRVTSVRARITQQIDLLVARRQALITAAVTGQLEIQGVAA